MKTILLSVITVLLSLGPAVHPIKMTTAKLDVHAKRGEVQTTINFFFDDFHAHMASTYSVDIGQLDETALTAIEAYVQDRFMLQSATGQAIPQRLTDVKMIDDNVIQVQLKGSLQPSASFTLLNSLLFDAFPGDQENIVHFFYTDLNGKKASRQILRFTIHESLQRISPGD